MTGAIAKRELSRMHRGAMLLLLLGVLSLRPATPARAAERLVTLTAADGQVLGGLLLTGPQRTGAGVVLLPMYRQTKESWRPLFAPLTDRGLTVLALDLRGEGDSRKAPDGRDLHQLVLARNPELFQQMHLDAEAGVRYLLTHGVAAGRVGLVGASVGCSVAIDTVTRGSVKVRAAVVMTPGTDYLGIPTMTQITKWPGIPLLILSSEEEASRGAAPIYRALKDRGGELKTFAEEDIHGTNMFGRVPGVAALIGDWLREHLQ